MMTPGTNTQHYHAQVNIVIFAVWVIGDLIVRGLSAFLQ